MYSTDKIAKKKRKKKKAKIISLYALVLYWKIVKYLIAKYEYDFELNSFSIDQESFD